MEPAHNDLVLELHVPDFAQAKNFYGQLGFHVIWERPPEGRKGYLVMKRGNTILCFWPGNEEVWHQEYFKRFPKTTPRGYGVEVVIMVHDIEWFYERAKRSAIVVEALRLKPWGLKDFRMIDPFGYYLRITEPYDTLDPENAVP